MYYSINYQANINSTKNEIDYIVSENEQERVE
jgi:hypothetical protein